MDRADDGIVTEALANGLPFDVIFLFVKNSRYKCGAVKLIIVGGGGGESAGSYEEGDFRKTEGGGAGAGASPEVFFRPEKGK